ncbi:oxidoreductase [Penicillium vulpinum]|nr:oxidoreductase [Penicillium vulpinum]KAJ5951568.1 oxidoreductase [Penicillium vulpinum]
MEHIKTKFSPNLMVAAATYNATSKFVINPLSERSPKVFIRDLGPSIRRPFNFAQAALPLMLSGDKGRYPPTVIFTGAMASLKGNSGLSTFSTSKFGARAIAQSLTRELGPYGVHVSHIIIDRITNTEKTKCYGQEIPDAKTRSAGCK